MSRVELVIARNPDPGSTLPYLLRMPLGGGLVFRTKETWPRTSALYCHPVPATERPEQPDVVERVPLRACARRSAAIDVVAHERYPYAFAGQQVRTVRRGLPCGDYAISSGGQLIASVERKSLTDLAELQVRWPSIPIVFCDTRKLAEEWTYRYLAAAHTWAETELPALARIGAGDVAGGPPRPEPSPSEIRAWAVASGLPVSPRGRLRPEIRQAWQDAHQA